MPWDFVLILLGLAVLIPWRGVVRIRRLLAQPALGASDRISLYASTIAFQWLIAGVVAWRALSRHLTPQELGLAVPSPWRTLSIAAGLTLLLCANQWASLRQLAKVPPEKRGFLFRFTEKIMPQSRVESLVFVALGCTAGLSEEFIYRGFVFAVFARVSENSVFPAYGTALVASSALFAVAHLYQGRRGLITTFVVGALFAVSRIWSGSLAPPMVAHIGVDLVVGLCAPRMLGLLGTRLDGPASSKPIAN